MPGGLIQIVAYGAQDLYLTGIPEITFFKFIYKRYTNFAIEFIELDFDGDKNFGQEISCSIPKDGDLINNMILKVVIPEVNLVNNTQNDSNTINLENVNDKETIYLNFKNFIEFIYESIKIIEIGVLNINQNYEAIKLSVNNYLDSQSDYLFKRNLVNINISNLFDISTDLNSIKLLSISEYEKKIKAKQLSDSYLDLSKSICKNLQDDLINAKKIYEESLGNRYNFSWINDLAWNIINETHLDIGGNIIDRQYSIWLNIWYHLFETEYKKLDIEKLHSKSSISYIYDKRSKPSFEIHIPLKFFFCRYVGLSIPLVSLRYQSVILFMKISSLRKLIKTDYSNNNLESLIYIKDIKLLTSYIFLDQDERTKFAESQHEYIIEQVISEKFIINKTNELNIDLGFSNPIKYYAFTIQNKNFIDLHNTHTSYGVQSLQNDTLQNIGDTMLNTNLELNGIERIKKMNNLYFSRVTSYESLKNTLPDGLYFHSFCIDPMEIQPSGSCNFSRLDRKRLNIKLENNFMNTINDTDQIIVNVVAVNYNILKFSNGLCNLVFNF